jgi:peptidoglycan hydrolase-like protein with peptidoglycan-binding domain
MSKCKRFLLLGSISMLLLAGCLFTFGTKAPIAHAAYSESCPPSQSYGNNNTWVQVIQFTLNAGGGTDLPHYPLATDGNFRQNTKDAVDWWQHNIMHITDGGDVVGDRTWSSMGFCTGFSSIFYHTGSPTNFSLCPGPLSNPSNGLWVQALQQMLNIDAVAPSYITFGPIPKTYNGDNWWPLKLDGSFGTHTENAVKALQHTNLITVDGSVGNQTWNAMAMCYFAP